MVRTILAGAALFALSAPIAVAKPADAEQQQSGGEAGKQRKSGEYEYDPHARGPYYGALVPPPKETFNKKYKVCTKEVTDGCINANQLKRIREREVAQKAAAAGEGQGGEGESGE